MFPNITLISNKQSHVKKNVQSLEVDNGVVGIHVREGCDIIRIR